MPFKKSQILIIAFLFLIITAACTILSSAPQVAPGQAETAVMYTAEAELTQISVNTLIAQLTQLAQASPTSPPPTETLVPPTLTATATTTATPLPPTLTPIIASVTPFPTSTPLNTPVPCLSVLFVTDVSVPDNTVMNPNQAFVKTWRLKNNGSCAWTPDFDIVFVGGSVLSAPGTQKLNTTINPGQTIDISISMIAPAGEGVYKGDWKLRSSTGIVFGLGQTGSVPFWVKIQVKPVVVFTPAPGTALDFASSYCQASWSSSTGNLSCPSPGEDFTNGAIRYTTTPKLEGGYQDDEPTLILIPNNGSGGFISGQYPAITVQAGDRFQALIGCLYNSPNCNVMFQLNYSIGGGAIQNLGTWTEVSDGNYTRIDVPVGGLAGQSVQFILYANNNNGVSTDDRLFVMVPRIKR
ncbi:MAG: hypothetical protein IT308_05195 [Anaerolineaceae bacterium]|nr:hypothetical protein [Anaerolineaceae bacterium]